MSRISRIFSSALSGIGIHIYRRGMPWGADMFRDVQLLAPLPYNAMVFDVGANEGQTLIRIKKALPQATVHCFEPATVPLRVLQSVAKSYPDVHCHQVALSASKGRALVKEADVSVMNQIEICDDTDASNTVERSTVDSVVKRLEITRIHLLKIDTEGHDLHVLQGASSSLHNGYIDYVLTEVGFGDADRFVSDIEVRRYLSQYGYRLLCVYDQAPTVRGHGWPHVGLYFANMLFVRRGLPSDELSP